MNTNYEAKKYFETIKKELCDRGYTWLTFAVDEKAHALFIGCLSTLKSIMIDYKATSSYWINNTEYEDVKKAAEAVIAFLRS